MELMLEGARGQKQQQEEEKVEKEQEGNENWVEIQIYMNDRV